MCTRRHTQIASPVQTNVKTYFLAFFSADALTSRCDVSETDSHVVRVAAVRVGVHQQTTDHRTAGERTRNPSETYTHTRTHTHTPVNMGCQDNNTEFPFDFRASYQDRGSLC